MRTDKKTEERMLERRKSSEAAIYWQAERHTEAFLLAELAKKNKEIERLRLEIERMQSIVKMDKEGFLPCPFCNGIDLDIDENHERDLSTISCNNDSCSCICGPFIGAREARKTWNTRLGSLKKG